MIFNRSGVSAHTVPGVSAERPTLSVTESSAKVLSINVLGVMNTVSI